MAATLHRPDAHRRRRHDARRQGPLRLPRMVQHPRRRHEFRFRTLGTRARSPRRRTVRGRHVARHFRIRPEGSVRGSGSQDARRLAGPALQRFPQGASIGALQVDAAVRDRRRLPEPVRLRDDQSRARSPRQHRSRQRARGVSPRGTRLGDDARPLDGATHRRRPSSTTGSSSATRSRSARIRVTCTTRGSRWCCSWGLGFKDRPWTAEQGEELVNFFKNDPQVRRSLSDRRGRPLLADAPRRIADGPGWAKVYRMFDAISPWDAGRFRDNAGMDRHARRSGKPTWPN